MNKKYIKRQITLHKLGIPISEDIKDYYEYFHLLIGNIKDFEELIYGNRISWMKNKIEALHYDKERSIFWIDYNIIWKNFEEKYDLDYDSISILLEGILEEDFKLRVDKAIKMRFVDNIVRNN